MVGCYCFGECFHVLIGQIRKLVILCQSQFLKLV